ncbi:acyl-CoA dehydrogenase family protein [Solimonas terrae]|uniref:Acyl-CoA/acyl-ACP dehydrogenase n=1 Tax=Solimonas terrae TaxID=1396819 RepID=A0A6M2BM43_9GAMM|nr:acyl-CoA dehydrogenase family protein [Solimonas terrae]NGY03331.1 acyl-CoA/acyl-ACP dehydrogenase [Solimonas terrae]
MNFDFSEEQVLLKEHARRLLEAECPSSVTRKVLEAPHLGFDKSLWKHVVELGWTGIAIPEEFGGTGMGHTDLCAIAEELGRVVAPIPFVSTVYLFAEAILQFGSEAQKRELLPRIAHGELIGCLATAEGPGYFSPGKAETRVVKGRMTGTKFPVTDGGTATHAIVAARSESGPGLFVVNLEGEGVSRTTLDALDPTRNLAKIAFEDAPCQPLDGGRNAGDRLAVLLNRAAVVVAFEQVGGAERCLEAALTFSSERYAFGRTINSYQAIKHKLADLYIKKEIARSNAYFGAWALSTNAEDLPRAAAAARIAGTMAYEFAAQESLQTHGGMGFTWEMDCHLHLRRSRQLALCLGALPLWREQLISCLEQADLIESGA